MRHAVVSLVKLVQVGVLASCSYPPLPGVVVPREVEQFSVTPSRDLDLQYDCAVSAVDSQDPAPGRALPACNREDASATNQPCWRLAADATSCPEADHRRLVVEGQAMLPADAYVSASCALVPAS